MKNLNFKFYSVLKNEDAMPYLGGNLLVAADGLGGSGSAVHAIDRARHADMHGDIMAGAFGDMKEVSPALMQYIEELIAPMVDGKDDTSALWASRIVIARCVYALTEGDFRNADLSDAAVRAHLTDFIAFGLRKSAAAFDLQKGRYEGQLRLPTTLAFIRYAEREDSVIAEAVWAGDSRLYALTCDGLKLLSVDDEDGSGAITNLFYADNDKTRLHYLRHELQKPCAFMAVSDGIFDPFDPNDHFGVESTLLSAMAESSSEQELANRLHGFYDSVHGDDATMAFVSFGFADLAEMKEAFRARTDRILFLRQRQAEMYSALEVMNMTEEEATHYIHARTSDRYEHILPMLVEAAESGVSDIALTSGIRRIIQDSNESFRIRADKERKSNLEKAFAGLDIYVREHPELVNAEILTDFRPQDKKSAADYNKGRVAYNEFKSAANRLAARLKDKKITASYEAALAAGQEELHALIQAKIDDCRKRFDALWCRNGSTIKKRLDAQNVLRVWENMDTALMTERDVQNIGILTKEERRLADAVQSYIVLARIAKHYVRTWEKFLDYLKRNADQTGAFLSSEVRHRLGFDAIDDAFSFGKGKRERLMAELRAQKEAVSGEIVKALATNYDKTSLIDGQYNATKLAMMRTYYALKYNPNNDVRALERQLLALGTAYTSLLK